MEYIKYVTKTIFTDDRKENERSVIVNVMNKKGKKRRGFGFNHKSLGERTASGKRIGRRSIKPGIQRGQEKNAQSEEEIAGRENWNGEGKRILGSRLSQAKLEN